MACRIARYTLAVVPLQHSLVPSDSWLAVGAVHMAAVKVCCVVWLQVGRSQMHSRSVDGVGGRLSTLGGRQADTGLHAYCPD